MTTREKLAQLQSELAALLRTARAIQEQAARLADEAERVRVLAGMMEDEALEYPQGAERWVR